MKVGDLVRSALDIERVGVVLEVIPRPQYRKFIYKVLWSARSPTLPSAVGQAWGHNLRLINEAKR